MGRGESAPCVAMSAHFQTSTPVSADTPTEPLLIIQGSSWGLKKKCCYIKCFSAYDGLYHPENCNIPTKSWKIINFFNSVIISYNFHPESSRYTVPLRGMERTRGIKRFDVITRVMVPLFTGILNIYWPRPQIRILFLSARI